jgi:hypothetical protein
MKPFIPLSVSLALLLQGCGAGAGSINRSAGLSPENRNAVASHVGRTMATDMALGAATALDPTGLSAIPASHLRKKLMEESHRKMIDDSLSSLPPEQRELMKKYMKGEMSEEQFQKELFAQYGLDENGNPPSSARN